MNNLDNTIVELGAQLGILAAKNTASTIYNKISVLKHRREDGKTITEYEEIINDLITEKQELIRIANAYKQQYENINISDEDMEYLHNTLKIVLESTSPDGKTDENLSVALAFLNKDTLKTMQLIGFNYKEGIGRPLTELCEEWIKLKLSPKKTQAQGTKKR
jgi:hypothetical protein